MDKEPSVLAVAINKQPGLYDVCWTIKLFYREKWKKTPKKLVRRNLDDLQLSG